MPKTKISEFSATPGNNTDIDGINIAEGCAPSGINDAIRELMSQLKDFQAGTAGDSFNGPVGTTTAAAGAFTTLSASGAVTLSGGTANGVPYLNGSKVLTTGSSLVFDGTNLGVGTSSTLGNSTVNAVLGFAARNSGATPGYFQTYNSNAGADLKTWRLGGDSSGNFVLQTVNDAYSSATTRLTADASGNLGLGVTPSAWQSIYRAAQFPAGVSVAGRNDGGIEGIFATNAFRNSAGTWTYVNNGVARRYVQEADGHLWLTAPSGTAGNAISFTQAMTLDASGQLGIGTSSPNYRADILASNFRGLRVQSSGDDAIITMGSQIASSQYWSIAATSNTSGQGANNFIIETTDSNAGGTVTPRLTISSAGNVGIGTSSPITRLHVNNAAATSTTQFANLLAQFSSNATNADASIQISNGVDNSARIGIVGGANLYFSQNGVERMRIDSSGNVGIGTSSPVNRLDVVGDINISVGNAYASNIYFSGGWKYKTNGFAGFIKVPDASGNIVFSQFANNVSGAGASGTELERMRIDSSGNLLVGATSQVGPFAQRIGASFNGGSTVGIAIRETGAGSGSRFTSFVNSAGSEIGTIQQSGTSAVAYVTSSDYRLKENIQPMTGVLEKVAALKPVTYKWKSDGSDGQGFIAHELAEVVPDCVVGEKDAVDAEGNPVYQGIDTSFLVATLTAAIQEQQAIINQLTARIEALEQA